MHFDHTAILEASLNRQKTTTISYESCEVDYRNLIIMLEKGFEYDTSNI